jgi:hypothetical protein
MILKTENRGIRRKNLCKATSLSTTNATWPNLNLNPSLGCVEAWMACHGTAQKHSETLIYYRDTTDIYRKKYENININIVRETHRATAR